MAERLVEKEDEVLKLSSELARERTARAAATAELRAQLRQFEARIAALEPMEPEVFTLQIFRSRVQTSGQNLVGKVELRLTSYSCIQSKEL